MSSISVVDNNVKFVDTNKNTYPQAHPIDRYLNNSDITTSSSSSSNSNVIVELTPSQKEELHEIYSHPPKNQFVDTEMYFDNQVISDSYIERDNKLEQLKKIAEIFIPIYTFLKSITPTFSAFDMFNFSVNFKPIVNFFNSVADISTTIYEIGKKNVCEAFETVKTVGEKVLNYSIDCGKKIWSFFTNVFSDNSATSDAQNTAIDSNEILLKDVANRNQLSSNGDSSTPYWKGLDKLNEPNQIVSTAKKFQNHFLSLRKTPRLDNSFLFEGEHSILQVNGQTISKYSPAAMLDDFKKAIPDLESRQLISSYANQNVLSQPYVELFAEHPELVNFKPKNSKFFYVVHEIEPGKFEFTATSQADLEIAYETPDHNKYNAFGVQASMILSKDQTPKITFSYYLR